LLGARAMFHVIARSIDHQLMFRTWAEARVLWDAIVRASPGLLALALMPDHLHMVHPLDVRRRLSAALSGYVRWRNHRRSERRHVFLPLKEPRVLLDESYVRTCIRYIHLNPCKPKLAADPLAWPFVTHRDACGLAIPAVVSPVQDARRFHRSVSTDKHVSLSGTDLPTGKLEAQDPAEVLAAVSALTRTPLAALRLRGRARTLYFQAARALCPRVSAARIAAEVGADPNTVLHAATRRGADVAVVAGVLGDPRFALLHDGRLSWPHHWYRA
jgi:REP element-mobilizing transposase RayT